MRKKFFSGVLISAMAALLAATSVSATEAEIEYEVDGEAAVSQEAESNDSEEMTLDEDSSVDDMIEEERSEEEPDAELINSDQSAAEETFAPEEADPADITTYAVTVNDADVEENPESAATEYGLFRDPESGTWYYGKDGEVDYSYTGFATNANGTWYVESGIVTKTPSGVYTLGQAFGVASDPGSTRSYLKLNSNYYWVDDSTSKYYNQLVDVSKTGYAWNSAEHLIDNTTAYKYVIAIDYNTACTPYKGSAIFLHCSTGSSTSGCVAISESNMVKVLKSLKSDTRIYIH